MVKIKSLKGLNKKQRDKLHKDILAAMENSTNVYQPIAVNKVNEVKRPMPFPSRDSRKNQINLGKGLDRIYGTKPTKNQEDYPEAVVLKVNRKIDVAVNKYLKFVWTYLFTATLLLYRRSLRIIFLSKQSTVSYQRVSKDK